MESVKTQAQSMSKLSLFSDVDSFSQKNIQKTAEAYEKMSAVQPGLTYSDAGRCMVRQRIGRCDCAWVAVVSRLGNFSERKRGGLISVA